MKHSALLLFLAAGAAGLPASAAPLSCFTNSASTPTIRSNGLWERAGDMLVICFGGTPTPAGSAVPKIDLTVALAPAVNITSRPPSPGQNASEALAIIDEPAPANQRACPAPANCTLHGATSGNTGINFANPGAASNGGQQVRNVYQADAPSGGTIAIRGIPFDAPGDLAVRTIRISNVYLNAAQLGVPPGIATFVNATISNSGGVNLNLPPAPLAIASAIEPVTYALLDAAGQPSSPIVLNRSAGNNAALAANPFATSAPQGSTFQVRMREVEAGLLHVRNGANWPNPNHEPDLVPQNQLGQLFTSETGFYNPAFPAQGGMRLAGLPTRGTRVIVRFSALPAGVKLFSPVRIVEPTVGTTLRRVFSFDNGDSGPLFLPVFATSPVDGGIAPLAGCPSDCHAVFEITSTDFSARDLVGLPFYVAFAPNAPAGAVSFRATLAPTSTHGGATALTAPRFAPPTAPPIPAVQIQ